MKTDVRLSTRFLTARPPPRGSPPSCPPQTGWPSSLSTTRWTSSSARRSAATPRRSTPSPASWPAARPTSRAAGCRAARDAIVALVEELLRRRVVDRDGVERDMTPEDILIVAPFNVQVRCLRHRLDPRIQIGSVDKFQGREAPVVIVSLCSSTLEEAPRGASFLLSPNRLNVAVSRAQALAIVVGCPDLMDVRCKSVEEMKLVNLLCHLVQYAEERRSDA